MYHADRFAPECTQILRPHNINHYFGEEAVSEDCLYLNIWAPPKSAASATAPVIVWMYGGGLSIGSASMANYDGENLARKGVVYVSIAYRIGALGFMAHPELTRDPVGTVPATTDISIRSRRLQWIQRNIERFGGDPKRVTVAGQSAGAGSAFSLQASPLARGLFHGIVGMSGGGLRMGADPIPQSEAEQSGLELQKVLKVGSLDDLRQVPADRILAAQAEFQLGGTAGTVRFRPNIDGTSCRARRRDDLRERRAERCAAADWFHARRKLERSAHCARCRRVPRRLHSNTSASAHPSSCSSIRSTRMQRSLLSVASAARDGGMATSIAELGTGSAAKRALAGIHVYVCACASVRSRHRPLPTTIR